MGGKSEQKTTQNSTTAPWEAAQPALQGILSQLQGNLGNTGVTGAESGALDAIVNNSKAGSATYSPLVSSYAKDLLGGGGAMDQAGRIKQGYQDYLTRTQGLADNTNYDPRSNPGMSDILSTLTSNITQGVNGQFAAAGRDFSGANSQALGRGLTQGLAPVLLDQYNKNRTAQQDAAGNILSAGNTAGGILSGLNQQRLANQGQGVTAAGQAVDIANAGANATLMAEAQRRGIPVQALGLLAQIGIPIGALGSQSQGTSTTEKQASGAEQFGQIAGGLTSLFGGGGGTTAGNIFKFISDRNAKEDIEQVGALFDGTPVYRYRYKGDVRFQIGLMAQDVEKYAPEAVGQIGEFKAVDYRLATNRALEVA